MSRYVGNQTTSFSDPSGHERWEAWGGWHPASWFPPARWVLDASVGGGRAATRRIELETQGRERARERAIYDHDLSDENYAQMRGSYRASEAEVERITAYAETAIDYTASAFGGGYTKAAVTAAALASQDDILEVLAKATWGKKVRGLSRRQVVSAAKQYAQLINRNVDFEWDMLSRAYTGRQQSLIRRYARHAGLTDQMDMVTMYRRNGNTYADFTQVAHPLNVNGRDVTTVTVPQHLRNNGNRQAHFDYLNTRFFGGINNQPEGWTWHHMGFGERMQLVPSGLHSALNHTGGMAAGHWGAVK